MYSDEVKHTDARMTLQLNYGIHCLANRSHQLGPQLLRPTLSQSVLSAPLHRDWTRSNHRPNLSSNSLHVHTVTPASPSPFPPMATFLLLAGLEFQGNRLLHGTTTAFHLLAMARLLQRRHFADWVEPSTKSRARPL